MSCANKETRIPGCSAELLDLLMEVPPDLENIKAELAKGYSPDQVSRTAAEYVDRCHWDDFEDWDDEWEDQEAAWDNNLKLREAKLDTTKSSAYLYEVIELLLDYGLDPNASYGSISILRMLPWVHNEYVGADTLALLFEHGANPMLEVDGENLFNLLDFDVIFDAIEQEDRRVYDALVHSWLVYLGYGAVDPTGELPITVFPERYASEEYGKTFRVTDLRKHRNYSFCMSFVEGRGEKWSLHVFDKRTRWEVARL